MPPTSPTTVHIRTHYRVCTVVPVDICTMYMSTCVRSKHMCWLLHWHSRAVRAVSGSTCCGCGLWSESGSGAGSNSHFNLLPLYICAYGTAIHWSHRTSCLLHLCTGQMYIHTFSVLDNGTLTYGFNPWWPV